MNLRLLVAMKNFWSRQEASVSQIQMMNVFGGLSYCSDREFTNAHCQSNIGGIMVDHEFIERCGRFILYGFLGGIPWIYNAIVFWQGTVRKRKEFDLMVLPVGGILLGISWWYCPFFGNVLRALCWLPFLTDGSVVSTLVFLCWRFYRRVKCRYLKSLRRKERQ